ncbi:MAG TPA: HVO_0476 family zinc finger protein [Candidatus Thermoplasmatota archaeon]|nr:HVO_0476 family zinc finger protein [Candidatus Thermoplasmatota archaeon]
MPRRETPAEEDFEDFEVEEVDEEDEGSAPGVPKSVEVRCKGCGEETVHKVVSGRVGARRGFTLEATVTCEECGTTHRVVVKEAPEVKIPAIVSRGATSARTSIEIPGDDVVSEGDDFIVDGRAAVVTGIELAGAKRVGSAEASRILTLWLKDFEEVRLRFTVNMGDKTIAKDIVVDPATEVAVGQEFVLGRLRVTVHGIKTTQRLMRRGTAVARDVTRLFARPTQLPESEKARKERNYKRAKALGIPLRPPEETLDKDEERAARSADRRGGRGR